MHTVGIPGSTFRLGDKLRDTVTAFDGIATGSCVYLTGCTQVLLTPRAKANGEAVDGCWFDIDRLHLVQENPQGIPKPREVPSAG